MAQQFALTEKLANRRALDYSTYEQLHHHLRHHSVLPKEGSFALHSIGADGVVMGARYYGAFHLNGNTTVRRPETAAIPIE